MPDVTLPGADRIKLKVLDLKSAKRERTNLYITLLAMLVVILLTFTSYMAGLLTARVGGQTETVSEGANLSNASWKISKITPDGAVYDVELMSSIGNVRTYKALRSFGLSGDGMKFAAISSSGTDIINMSDESRLKFDPPFAFTGDNGDVIGWSADSKFFGMAVFKEEAPQGTHILVYGSDGKIVKDIEASVAYQMINNKPVPFPVKFSPASALMLARTYSTDDLTDETAISNEVQKVPAILRVYDTTGHVVKEIELANSLSESTAVIYQWGERGKTIQYLVQGKDMPVDYSRPGLFTKVGM